MVGRRGSGWGARRRGPAGLSGRYSRSTASGAVALIEVEVGEGLGLGQVVSGRLVDVDAGSASKPRSCWGGLLRKIGIHRLAGHRVHSPSRGGRYLAGVTLMSSVPSRGTMLEKPSRKAPTSRWRQRSRTRCRPVRPRSDRAPARRASARPRARRGGRAACFPGRLRLSSPRALRPGACLLSHRGFHDH